MHKQVSYPRTRISDYGGHIDGVAYCYNANSSSSFLAVAVSNLAGNIWNSWLLLSDPSSISPSGELDLIFGLEIPCGMADICWSKKENVIIAAEDSGDLKVYAIRNDEEAPEIALVASLTNHNDIVSCVSTFDESSFVVSGSWDKTVKLWDIQSALKASPNKYSCIYTMNAHSRHVTAVSCSSTSSNLISSASADSTVKLWDYRVQPIESSSISTFHLNFVPHSLAWSPLYHYTLAAGCEDGSIIFLDTRMITSNAFNNAQISSVQASEAPINTLKFSPLGTEIVAGSDDGSIIIMRSDASDDKWSSKPHQANCHSDYCRAIDWDPLNSKSFVSGGWDASLKLLNLDNISS